MAEKKKLAVVMDVGSTTPPPTGQSFDFAGFQESLGDSSANRNAAARPNDGANGTDSSYTTSYQTRKTSIADGLTTEQLVVEHRKSIANATGADAANLGGVTLSRRQSMSNEEYACEVTENAYTHLEPYQFKDQENGATQ